MSDKPREFWIIKEEGFSTWVSDRPLCSADTTEEIHVVEYSAYEEERKRSIARKHEIHRLRSELSRLK